jgi:hypothetical protein
MYLHLKARGKILSTTRCSEKETEKKKKDPRPYQGYHEPVEKQWAISAPHTCCRVTSHIAVTSAKEPFPHNLSRKLTDYQHLLNLLQDLDRHAQQTLLTMRCDAMRKSPSRVCYSDSPASPPVWQSNLD